eukprot:CAMPEP_0182476708 /NCGR_PEP_ID=MMETSP1319-20130603/29577_1 /TAXON_ID=172717 /ORGANISM="Bolidomonas pacifica, Strain RCC208" /LENGTH=96 /DNA_ID=CAMNT_0024677817 /DNA_START=37 /DNA_END=324 /DNA_ORIENTATION=+
MAPMVFFIFEVVSCISSNGFPYDQCQNTTSAAMWLSVYTAIISGVTIAHSTVPKNDRGEGLMFTNIATLKFKIKEKVQGALGVVTALVSMYLFSVL